MTIPGLEKLCQDFADRDEAYAREYFLTGDGVPKPEAMERKVKACFLELLGQHPELTRPQAYMQAVMEITEPDIIETIAATNDDATVLLVGIDEDDDGEGWIELEG